VAPGSGYLEDARRAARFVQQHLWDAGNGTLLRRYRNGAAGVQGYAEDYAYLIFGLLELFQADGDPAWLEWAVTLQKQQDTRFWDATEGGWFSTTGDDASVLLRLKEDYDGAEPSASSVSALNLLMLSHLVDHADMAEKITRVFAVFARRLTELGRAVPMMLTALSAYHAGVSQVVIVGDPGDAGTWAMLQAAGRRYLPFTVQVPLMPQHRERLGVLLPWTAAMTMRDGKATAYVCRNFTCEAPTTSVDELRTRAV
jgi:uncharacterized protein YyaL (SSP411 family)